MRRFGRRRRQCGRCGRTWTIRPRKRGRPAHRMPVSLLHKVLVQGFTLRQLSSRRTGIAGPAYRYRFRHALRRYVARPSPQPIPRGPLVLLADGLYFQFAARPWVLYLTALKPCTGTHAVFLDPVLCPGREGASRWRQAVAAVPPHAHGRVAATRPRRQQMRASSATQERPNRFDRDQHDPVAKRRAEKPVSLIEAHRVIVDRMGDHGTGPREVGNHKTTPQGIGEQRAPKALALVSGVDGEAPNEEERDVLGHVAPELRAG